MSPSARWRGSRFPSWLVSLCRVGEIERPRLNIARLALVWTPCFEARLASTAAHVPLKNVSACFEASSVAFLTACGDVHTEGRGRRSS
jgi:hypothetical protein